MFKCVEGMLPQRGGCKRGADAERERALSVRTGGALARARLFGSLPSVPPAIRCVRASPRLIVPAPRGGHFQCCRATRVFDCTLLVFVALLYGLSPSFSSDIIFCVM